MKQLTPDTLFERDERMDFWSAWGLGGAGHPTEQWVAWFLEPQLPLTVPAEIAEMFERVKALACYATCHYPLFVLAGDELSRIQDAALVLACRRLRAPKKHTGTYASRIAWAVDQGLIASSQATPWEASRQLRNHASHRTEPSLYGPNDVRSMLSVASEMIGGLFDELERVAGGQELAQPT